MSDAKVTRSQAARLTIAVMSLALLAACEEGAMPSFLQSNDSAGDSAPVASNSTKLVERDVEAPDVFQVTEAGLWDGRPSLGGVWVAHPDAKDPERVIIRNSANGKFVIGALFRREREIPGPRLQASSDAAAALGMLAGAPVELNVTALRRETVDETPTIEDAADVEVATLEPNSDTSGDISQTQLDPIAGAAAALEASTPAAPTAPTSSSTLPAKVSPLAKPYIQIGIFSVEANAKGTAGQMRNAGMIPTVIEQTSNGKPFWRVVVGPAQSNSERSALLKKVKSAGFSDAYAVTN
ncbi:SPOR domain-containing protein [Parasedimentitalea huanghaiensis]|uniref:SPOR domain-containing protein n=1 Tax=Parasedimentitalea huanghaiensis TaxID=2682100 RepID=A0A6L6WKV3_9RHOB|nr:SPOR domain-containing protein [Zongyanglinia huanghaiensis]MVO16657.1 SPOR domain-containing protein [Zongyanglinia huanghaiensis]